MIKRSSLAPVTSTNVYTMNKQMRVIEDSEVKAGEWTDQTNLQLKMNKKIAPLPHEL